MGNELSGNSHGPLTILQVNSLKDFECQMNIDYPAVEFVCSLKAFVILCSCLFMNACLLCACVYCVCVCVCVCVYV